MSPPGFPDPPIHSHTHTHFIIISASRETRVTQAMDVDVKRYSGKYLILHPWLYRLV